MADIQELMGECDKYFNMAQLMEIAENEKDAQEHTEKALKILGEINEIKKKIDKYCTAKMEVMLLKASEKQPLFDLHPDVDSLAESNKFTSPKMG